MSSPFLLAPNEICLVTPSIEKTINRLQSLGIGPWKRYTFSTKTVSNMTFRGQAASFELKVGFATQGAMTWEIMQPISGPSIMKEFLDANGNKEGFQHVACDLKDGWENDHPKEVNGIGVEDVRGTLRVDASAEVLEAAVDARRKRAVFESKGWKCVMSGTWHGATGSCEFQYFEKIDPTIDSHGTPEASTEGSCFETIVFSKDWREPEESRE